MNQETADARVSTSSSVTSPSPARGDPAMLAAAAVKLPEFWQSDPASWFQHVEALFHLRGVHTDDARYYLVVAALDQQSTRRAMPLLRSPPPQEKYAALKEFLLRRYSLSASERAEKILSMSGLGDSSAVDLMDSMLSLLGSDEGGFLFPHIFLRQLPPPVRAALANSPRLAAGDYRGLAEEADRVLLATRRFAVQHVTSDAHLQETEDDPVSVSAVGEGARRGTSLCRFHQRFGRKAKRCVPPCAFLSSGNAAAGTR
ncbi:uncharacterized protein LOC144987873 [Oryzias latipes]